MKLNLTVKQLLIVTVLFCVAANANSQMIDTIYFDKDDNVCNREDYFYRREVAKTSTTTYAVKDYFFSSALRLTASVIAKKRYRYDVNDWVHLGDDLKSPLEIDGEWLSYYLTGKPKGKRVYDEGEILESLRYDEDGGDPVYYVVDSYPEFIGGENAIREYLAENVRYPESAQNKGIQGRVYVSFVVDVNGNVKDCVVARGVDKDLDIEAMRVVASLPEWKPGEHKGQKVCVAYTIPINFILR